MSIVLRPGTAQDARTTFDIFVESLSDLGQRTGAEAVTGGSDPASIERQWQERGSLFEHLSRSAFQFWMAEDDGGVVGYARSVLRDDVLELTEFFLRPDHQSSGLGRQLFERAFPLADGQRGLIVATLDTRAVIRYLKAGLVARFPIRYFSRTAEPVMVETDLRPEPIDSLERVAEDLQRLDRATIGHARLEDHAWLIGNREGFLFRRGREAVGYGYVGVHSGPFAWLEARDAAAILAHAESEASRLGIPLGVETPLINRAALDVFLARGYRTDDFTSVLMATGTFGAFENYLLTGPPIIL
jgi:GNAT superfamily N-acetyltransferase